MTTNEILELVRAGYTREEIDALGAPAEPAPVPEDPELVPEPAPEPAHEEAPDVSKMIADALAPVIKQMSDLTKAVQASNAAAARSPEPAGQSVDSIMADFFGPAKGGKT